MASATTPTSLAQMMEQLALSDLPPASAATLAKIKADAEAQAQARVEAQVKSLYSQMEREVIELREVRRKEKAIKARIDDLHKKMVNVLSGKSED